VQQLTAVGCARTAYQGRANGRINVGC